MYKQSLEQRLKKGIWSLCQIRGIGSPDYWLLLDENKYIKDFVKRNHLGRPLSDKKQKILSPLKIESLEKII